MVAEKIMDDIAVTIRGRFENRECVAIPICECSTIGESVAIHKSSTVYIFGWGFLKYDCSIATAESYIYLRQLSYLPLSTQGVSACSHQSSLHRLVLAC